MHKHSLWSLVLLVLLLSLHDSAAEAPPMLIYLNMDGDDGATVERNRVGARQQFMAVDAPVRDGHFGGARCFQTGTVNRIELTDVDLPQLGGYLSLWVKNDRIDEDYRLLSKSLSGIDWDFQAGYDVANENTAAHFRLRVRVDGEFEELDVALNIYDAKQHLGEWEHMIIGYNSLKIQAFRNGVLLEEKALVGMYDPHAMEPLVLGTNPIAINDRRGIDGCIDEFKLFGVTAGNQEFTAALAEQLMNDPMTTMPPTTPTTTTTTIATTKRPTTTARALTLPTGGTLQATDTSQTFSSTSQNVQTTSMSTNASENAVAGESTMDVNLTPSDEGGISTGVLIGLIIAIVVVLVLIGLLIYILLKKDDDDDDDDGSGAQPMSHVPEMHSAMDMTAPQSNYGTLSLSEQQPLAYSALPSQASPPASENGAEMYSNLPTTLSFTPQNQNTYSTADFVNVAANQTQIIYEPLK